MEFPIGKTKVAGVDQKFDLNDTEDRKKYFQAKVGTEIKKLQDYLKQNVFFAFMIGKKNSGKGTYTKMFMEQVDSEHVGHVAVGDIVRDIHKALENEESKKDLVNFLEKNYRGFHSVQQTIDQIEGRSQSSLISSELIIALIKYEMSKRKKQAIFFDGFPRAHDQIGASMYLKELLGYVNEPDFFVFIDLPNTIIDERIKYRVVCPICKTPRNLRLLATKDVGWDADKKQFYLMCDTPSCNKARMLPKEGDELGIEPIRERLEVDGQILQKLTTLTGIPKIYLRNSVPVDLAKDYVDDYELTPAYEYRLGSDGRVEVIEKPWIVKDDNGVDSYSLLPPAVMVSLIKQIVAVLGL